MTQRSGSNYNKENGKIVGMLGLERCRGYLAHMHAIMYMCKPEDAGLDPVAAGNMRRLMELMDGELQSSYAVLGEKLPAGE